MMCGWPNPLNAADWRMHIPFQAFAPCNVSKDCSAIPALGSLPSFVGKKTCCGVCGTMHHSFYDRSRRQVRDLSARSLRIYLDLEVRRVFCRQCAAVKRERLELLADNPYYTKRFAYYVGRRCRSATIKDIAEELQLDWETVKELDKQYMREQLERAGTPGPKVIGIDEVSIRKGHTYRIVVSDLERHRPIWFGGEDRSEASMDGFYRFIGEKKARKHPPGGHGHVEGVPQLHHQHAPQAAILFDKFHVIRHLGEALDKVRKAEYARLEGKSANVHQGAEVHAAVASAEPHRPRPQESETAARRQQAPEYRLPAEGVFRPALGLLKRGLGAKVLR